MADLIILDTNIYIDIFRSGISASKTITEFLAINRKKIWVPLQVVEEYQANHLSDLNKVPYDKVSQNMKKSLAKHKAAMIDDLLFYKRRESNNFTQLKNEVENELESLDDIIDRFVSSLKPEKEELESMKREAKLLVDHIMLKQSGQGFNVLELLDIFKEGELRYRYKIPPGYSDAKNKEGKIGDRHVNKKVFGDLIIWKEIIEKAKTLPKGSTVYFYTNDVKEDMFINKQPRPEMLEEFSLLTDEVKLEILCFKDVIMKELERNGDKYALLEIDMHSYLLRVLKNNYNTLVNDFINSGNREDVFGTISNYQDYIYFFNNVDVEKVVNDITIKDTALSNAHLSIDNEVINYRFTLEMELNDFDIESLTDEVLSVGEIKGAIVATIELMHHKYDTDELTFKTRDVKSIGFKNTSFTWFNDFDYSEESEDGYTTCPTCGNTMNFENDGGNGFCISCSD